MSEPARFQLRSGVTHTIGQQGRSFVLSETLSQLEAVLDPATFFRLNRSERVHLRAVARL